MSKNKLIECPSCIGTGEVYSRKKRKDSTCDICKGEGKVHPDIAHEFINTIQVNFIEEDGEYGY